MSKTLYLWDLAGTLFLERWDSEKGGFPDYNAYVVSLGYNLKTISPRQYEEAYEIPYRNGLFDLQIVPDFKEVLTWTKNNAVFTTGNREQIDWRAEQLLSKGNIDIRDYLKEIYSTFDYGNTNVKIAAMIKDILQKKSVQGFETFVYTDDKLANCQFFKQAAADYNSRVYHMCNDNSGLRERDGYWEIGSLYDMMENEQ